MLHDKNKRDIVRLYHRTGNVAEIHRLTGHTRGTIAKVLRESGTKVIRRLITKPKNKFRENIVRLYKEGMTINEIAQKVRMDNTKVMWALKYEGCPTRKRGPKRKIDLHKARELRECGKTLEEIGKQFGISRQAVCLALKGDKP